MAALTVSVGRDGGDARAESVERRLRPWGAAHHREPRRVHERRQLEVALDADGRGIALPPGVGALVAQPEGRCRRDQRCDLSRHRGRRVSGSVSRRVSRGRQHQRGREGAGRGDKSRGRGLGRHSHAHVAALLLLFGQHPDHHFVSGGQLAVRPPVHARQRLAPLEAAAHGAARRLRGRAADRRVQHRLAGRVVRDKLGDHGVWQLLVRVGRLQHRRRAGRGRAPEPAAAAA